MGQEIYSSEQEVNDKRELRKRVMQQRDMIDEKSRMHMDQEIFDRVTECSFYRNAAVIFIFVNYISEVDTKRIIMHAIRNGKTICVPKVISKEEGLALYRINSLNDLVTGYHGILEPDNSCERIDPDLLELIVMPGVAFDLSGGRIGYGGGFYDRFIAALQHEVKKIAIAYELQILDRIPMDAHDARIDGIITEQRTTIFGDSL